MKEAITRILYSLETYKKIKGGRKKDGLKGLAKHHWDQVIMESGTEDYFIDKNGENVIETIYCSPLVS